MVVYLPKEMFSQPSFDLHGSHNRDGISLSGRVNVSVETEFVVYKLVVLLMTSELKLIRAGCISGLLRTDMVFVNQVVLISPPSCKSQEQESRPNPG